MNQSLLKLSDCDDSVFSPGIGLVKIVLSGFSIASYLNLSGFSWLDYSMGGTSRVSFGLARCFGSFIGNEAVYSQPPPVLVNLEVFSSDLQR
jgi:hypothetical protein